MMSLKFRYGTIGGLCLSVWMTSTATWPSQVAAQVQEQRFPVNGGQRTSRLPTLAELVPAKLEMEGEQPRLIMMLDSFREETRTGPVRKIRLEQRTRVVTLPDGTQKEETISVSVPYTEEAEYKVPVPAGRKPVAKPASDFRFFDLEGQELSQEEVATRLERLRPIFLLEQSGERLPEIPEGYRQVLQPDCVIAVTDQRVRPSGQAIYAQPNAFADPFAAPIAALPAPVFRPVAPAADVADNKPAGTVEGVVTLNGKPLADASVIFVPVAGGRPAGGRTNEAGRYTLNFAGGRKEIPPGEYRIRISTLMEAYADQFGNPVPGQAEMVPAKYNVKSTLKFTVVDGAKNIANFDLKQE